jgi:hypothetical protein
MSSLTIDREGFLANAFQTVKGPCRVATTANITLSGVQTIDDVAVVADDRVLVKDQSNGFNAIYVCKTGDWELADDFDQRGHVVQGTRVFVNQGTVNALTEWYVSTTGRPYPGRQAVAFAQLSSADLAAIAALTSTRGDLIVGGASAWTDLALGTAGYHLQSDGTDAGWAGFLQSGSGPTTRTWQDKARDIVSLKDWGAVGDGTTDDTTAVTSADADTRAKFAPAGTYDVTLGATDLDGPYWGFGQIRDSANNLRAPFFSAIKAAPASEGDHDSISTAFNGDLSKVQFAVEHRITGTATLGQPTTGYHHTPEAFPHFTYLRNESGHNEGTADNEGRTCASAHFVKVDNVGQGDGTAFHAHLFVNSTKTGSTHFLANPGGVAYHAQLDAGQAGVYLNAGEFSLADGGFDAAGIGWVVNMDRSVATGAKTATWIGFRAQSIGTADINAFFSATGPCDVGLDFSHITTDTSKAAIALKADDRIYGNASSTNSFYATALGDEYFVFSSSLNRWHFVVDNTSVFQVGDDHVRCGPNFSPITSEAASLGTTAIFWSGLFLASGAAVNFNNGDVTLTHGSTNLLTVAGGDFAVGATALSTSAVDGLIYIPSSTSGSTLAPIGTPTGRTGTVPMVYATGNNRLWVYNGAWRSTTLSS